MSAPKLVMQPQASKVGWLGSQLPLDGTGDFTVTRASTATRINASGLLETVPANVPIIDHSNGCPELVVEPQVTQLLGMTQQFDNAYWSKSVGINVTPNTVLAPDGTMTADIIEKTISGDLTILKEINLNTTGLITGSIHVLKDNNENRFPEFFLRSSVDGGQNEIYLQFNTKTGVTLVRHKTENASFKIEEVGLYWKLSLTLVDSLTSIRFGIRPAVGVVFGSFSEAALGSITIWGAQLQTGSVATSYIPNATTGTVTKVADVITGQTNANNFNSAEGTLFVEMSALSNDGTYRIISINNGIDYNSGAVNLYYDASPNVIRYEYVTSGGFQSAIFSTIADVKISTKVAVTWKLNEFKLYINGVKVSEDLLGDINNANTFSQLSFKRTDGFNFYGRVKQLQCCPSALTLSQIQAL